MPQDSQTDDQVQTLGPHSPQLAQIEQIEKRTFPKAYSWAGQNLFLPPLVCDVTMLLLDFTVSQSQETLRALGCLCFNNSVQRNHFQRG